jgi:hypothetical protein
MNRTILLILTAVLTVTLASCQRHPTLRYTPQEYAKLRKVEILLTEPTRSYRVIAVVTGLGGKLTAKETMMNAMIDEARKAGADALIPLEFAAGQPASLVEPFLRTENGRTITKGNAIKWETDPRWSQ